jgi:DNA-binding transcriptional MerR regulator
MTKPDPRWAFNTSDAQRLSGVSARRLQYWDETDFIRPSIAARQGRGWPRLYAFRDIVQLRVAALLRDRLSLQALRRLKVSLDIDAPFATVRFAVDPSTNELVYLGPTGQPESPRAPGQIVLTFELPLAEIRADLVTCRAATDPQSLGSHSSPRCRRWRRSSPASISPPRPRAMARLDDRHPVSSRICEWLISSWSARRRRSAEQDDQRCVG